MFDKFASTNSIIFLALYVTIILLIFSEGYTFFNPRATLC